MAPSLSLCGGEAASLGLEGDARELPGSKTAWVRRGVGQAAKALGSCRPLTPRKNPWSSCGGQVQLHDAAWLIQFLLRTLSQIPEGKLHEQLGCKEGTAGEADL